MLLQLAELLKGHGWPGWEGRWTARKVHVVGAAPPCQVQLGEGAAVLVRAAVRSLLRMAECSSSCAPGTRFMEALR